MDTLRLLYPQWQGGDIAHWFSDLSAREVAQGYYLGAQILNLLAPKSACPTLEVPISLDYTREGLKSGANRSEAGTDGKANRLKGASEASKGEANLHAPNAAHTGIEANAAEQGKILARTQEQSKARPLDFDIIKAQTKAALNLLSVYEPRRILTLGGECSVSVAPFSYLAARYKGECALLWLDAHPDLGLPQDSYKGYHAMALSALLGEIELLGIEGVELPATLTPDKILLAGLHSEEANFYADRQRQLGIQSLSASECEAGAVCAWIRRTGARRLLIHLDLDVLDSRELRVAVGDTGRVSVEKLLGVIEAVKGLESSGGVEIVGFSVCEHLPRELIKLRNILNQLPLMS